MHCFFFCSVYIYIYIKYREYEVNALAALAWAKKKKKKKHKMRGISSSLCRGEKCSKMLLIWLWFSFMVALQS